MMTNKDKRKVIENDTILHSTMLMLNASLLAAILVFFWLVYSMIENSAGIVSLINGDLIR